MTLSSQRYEPHVASDDLLKDLCDRTLVTSVHQHCLKHALRCYKPGTDHIPKLVLSLIIHVSKDDDRFRVASTLENTFSCA